MPVRKPCSRPNCPALLKKGQVLCPEHYSQELKRWHLRYKGSRGKTAQRGYDSAWRRCRMAFIQEMLPKAPCCNRCNNHFKSLFDIQVDHIKPLADGGERLDFNNLQLLCRKCHAIKTAEDNR